MSIRTQIVAAGISLVSFSFLVAGCSPPRPQPQTPPPVVKVVAVEQQDVPIYGEWIGTLDGMVNAEIKAQVSGYLLSQHYTEGSLVRKGQLLFALDPRPFQAVLDQARGQLAEANAQELQAEANLIVIYVTHNVEDAFAVGHRMALMRDGKIERIGTPHEVSQNSRDHQL